VNAADLNDPEFQKEVETALEISYQPPKF